MAKTKCDADSCAIVDLKDLLALRHYIYGARMMVDRDYDENSYTDHAISESTSLITKMTGYL